MIVPMPPKTSLTTLMDDYPWTMMLTFLNLLFFWMLFAQPPSITEKEKTEFSTEFIESAGRYYLEWSEQNQYGRQPMELQAFGARGVRDSGFIQALKTWKSSVDPVGFKSWQKEFDELFAEQAKKPIAVFGLLQGEDRPFTWITYQFSHQSATHLFSNLVLMIFFAACVEKIVGGFMMGLIYLMGGVMGGYFFMLMDQSGLIPMVGASASVTALMGFVATGSLKRNIPYFYFLSPFKGFYGQVYLSPLWVISLFLVEDLTQILSDPPGWGAGVAYSAHLGGAFAGLVLGLAHKWGARSSDFTDGRETAS